MSVKETMNGFGRDWLAKNGTIDSYQGWDSIPERATVEFEDAGTTQVGCETCGPWTEYRVDITAYADRIESYGVVRTRVAYGTYEGSFQDLLFEIFRWEEHNGEATA